ncbi:hypothetical protein N8K70_03735 [Microbacterium betulae]|uniref:Uncharacterized protein n=1 Tax=Microbacterium betulae TaxID=2981139 RepID=A0AA97FIG2_9MICO|nr:hypothetical protein [Microbacterium sp. AB]WOF23801.1 hypothetical protein N8K70_03735 [Microbacterium sp. AB]
MAPAMLPDESGTRIAIGVAELQIEAADGDVVVLLDREGEDRAMIGHAIAEGKPLADARMWAITAALVRDAVPTLAEVAA